jgi:hypothetical protein
VLDNALANAERKIQSAMRCVTLLEVLDDAQRMQVVVEPPPMMRKAAVERPLPRMSKGRVADVVDQRKRLGQVFVQAKLGGSGAGDLRDLNGVGQTAAKVVRGATGEYLCLPCQPAEGTRLHDTLPITLKRCTRGAKRRRMDAGQERIVRISCDRAPMEIDCHSQT